MKALSSVLVPIFGGALLLSGCATEIHPQPVSFHPTAVTGPTRVLVGAADGRPESGSSRALQAGTELREVGTLPQGAVYRAVNHEIQVRAGDRYEAYIVVSGTNWLGYYLPSEHAYLPLKQPTELNWINK